MSEESLENQFKELKLNDTPSNLRIKLNEQSTDSKIDLNFNEKQEYFALVQPFNYTNSNNSGAIYHYTFNFKAPEGYQFPELETSNEEYAVLGVCGCVSEEIFLLLKNIGIEIEGEMEGKTFKIKKNENLFNQYYDGSEELLQIINELINNHNKSKAYSELSENTVAFINKIIDFLKDSIKLSEMEDFYHSFIYTFNFCNNDYYKNFINDLHNNFNISLNEFIQKEFQLNDLYSHLILVLLDNYGILTHGVSIRCASLNNDLR